MLRFEKDALFEPNFHPNFDVFKEEMDDLIMKLQHHLNIPFDGYIDTTMLLPLYLASKYVYNSISFLEHIIVNVIIDPTDLPYNEYAEKFEELADSFSYSINKLKEEERIPYDLDDSWEEYFDFCQIDFGCKKEALFPPIEPEVWNPEKKGGWVVMAGDVEIGSSDRIRRPKSQVSSNEKFGTLSQTIDILFNNKEYLLNAIWTCLEDLAEMLRSMDRIIKKRIYDSKTQEDLFISRRQDYLDSSVWEDARNELYNDIKLLGGIVEEIQVLSNVKTQIYYRLKNNTLGLQYVMTNFSKDFLIHLYSPFYKITQTEFNDFLKLHCQYKQICKLVDYHKKWNLSNENVIFANNGIAYIMNEIIPYLSSKINFDSRQSYAALWQALIDLNLLKKIDAESFKNWVNGSILRDAPNDSSRKGKINSDKSIRKAVEDLYKLQTHDGLQKQFRDLTEEEISCLNNGEKLKPLYRDCILILSKAFDINLVEESFQPYITKFPDAETYLSDFPQNIKCSWILECFRAYEDFAKH